MQHEAKTKQARLEWLGTSEPMLEVRRLVQRVAPTEVTVLLTGETGTGKGVVAEAIHDLSPRRAQAFVPVNCGAIQPSLIESELFGHEAGSFTGASRRRRGLFERASGGTLLLDEVTEMDMHLQVKLLRALESGSIRRVGGEGLVPIDVRVVAATNRDPARAVEDGRLREDLYYRLNVFGIEVPPLRERGADVERLARAFLVELGGEHGSSKRLRRSALEALRRHPWPGNVRELRNSIARAHVLADHWIEAQHLRLAPGAAAPGGDGVGVEVGQSLAEAEQRLILATLEAQQGDKKRTATQLGISLKTLYNRLNRYAAARDARR